jgi:hypothetical protein
MLDGREGCRAVGLDINDDFIAARQVDAAARRGRPADDPRDICPICIDVGMDADFNRHRLVHIEEQYTIEKAVHIVHIGLDAGALGFAQFDIHRFDGDGIGLPLRARCVHIERDLPDLVQLAVAEMHAALLVGPSIDFGARAAAGQPQQCPRQ